MSRGIVHHYPNGEAVFILGLAARSNGRFCENHYCCGTAVRLDAVLRLRVVQVVIRGREETGTIAA